MNEPANGGFSKPAKKSMSDLGKALGGEAPAGKGEGEAAGEGSGDGQGSIDGEAKTKVVELDDGVKIALPIEEADKLIAKRTAKHAEQKQLKDKLAQLENQIKSFADAEKTKIEEAGKNEKMNRGEFDKVIKENIEKHNNEIQSERAKLTKLGGGLVEERLRGTLASLANLNQSDKAHKTLLDDNIEILRNKARYNFDTGSVEVVDNTGNVVIDSDNGENLKVEKFLQGYLQDRPYIVQKKVAKSITEPGKSTVDTKNKKTWADLNKAMAK